MVSTQSDVRVVMSRLLKHGAVFDVVYAVQAQLQTDAGHLLSNKTTTEISPIHIKNKTKKKDSTANPRMNELRHLECELHQFGHEAHEILVPHVVKESQQELVARLEEDRRGLNHAMSPPPSPRQHAGLCYIRDCCTDHYVVGQADAED